MKTINLVPIGAFNQPLCLMKKSLLYLAACVLVIAACSKKEEEAIVPKANEGRIITLNASVSEDNTKVAVVDHKYNWQAGDKVAVFQDDGSAEPITFEAESSGSSSKLTAVTDKTVGKYAIYPYKPSDASDFEWVDISGDEIMSIVLPDMYIFQESALNIPMLGTISGSNATFKAIGGVLRFTVNNIPANAKYFSFMATNKKIAGAFDFEASATTPQLDLVDSATGKEVVIEFMPGTSSRIFSVPSPVGTIDGFTMALYDDNLDLIYSVTSTANISVARNDVITAPTWTVPNIDVLNRTFTGVSIGTSYSSWDSKSGQSSTAVYAGNSAGGQNADATNGTIQLRSSDNSGIVTTTTGGLIRKIVVDWHSNTSADRTLDIYGKQTAYSSTSDLFNASAQGELIGSIVKGTSTELVIAKNKYYPYIGIRSNNGAQYIKSISIAWDTDTRSTLTSPTFSETEGVIPVGTIVYLSSAESANIKYTVDGTTPTESSTAYTDAGIVVDDDVIIKAIAIKDGWKNSTVASISYTVPVCATPTFDTAEGSITSGDDVVIENNESGAVIYYTTDGTEPDGDSTYGAAGADVTIADIDATTTIKAFARKAGMKDSPIASATYTVSGSTLPLSAPSTITFEPYSDTFTATWENNANATGYEWVISTSSTAAGINLSEDAHGDYTVASPGSGITLSAGTWTITKSVTLTIATKYYLYVKVKGDGSTYSDSGYSTPVNKIVPLVINVSNVSRTSYNNSETSFTSNLISFGYTRVMQNSNSSPTDWKNNQAMQFAKKETSKDPGVIYNKGAMGTSIKNIRVHLAVNDNAFTVAYGTTSAVSTGSKTKAQATSNGSYSINATHKTSGTVAATVKYYDFDLSSSNVNYFKITNGSGVNYIWKIEIIYQ